MVVELKTANGFTHAHLNLVEPEYVADCYVKLNNLAS
jgi:hypothetical protein